MKKNSVLIFAAAVLLLNFLCCWYADTLFNRLFIFALVPHIISLIALLVCVVFSVVGIIQHRTSFRHYVSFIICIVSVFLMFMFPFRTAKVKLEMSLFEKQRLQVVEMVRDGEITYDYLGNAELPSGYRHTSSDGEIYIYQNDGDQVICFWVFRGMLSGSVQLMYSSQDESLIYKNETPHEIVSIEKLKEHWYLVHTDY